MRSAVGVNLNRPPDSAGCDRVFIIVEPHLTSLGDRRPTAWNRRNCRHRDELRSFGSEYPPRSPVRQVLDAGAPWRRQCACPTATRLTRRDFEPRSRREGAFTENPDLVLELALLPARRDGPCRRRSSRGLNEAQRSQLTIRENLT
jgi:hypothetical protein